MFMCNLNESDIKLVCKNHPYRHLIILVFCHFLGTIANSWVSSGSNGIPNSSNPPSGFGANPFRTRPDQPGFGMNSGKKVPALLSVVPHFTHFITGWFVQYLFIV